MPPPMLSGISSFRMAWWYGNSRKSRCPVMSSCWTRVSLFTRTPMEVSSWRRFVTGFHTRMSPLRPCMGRPSAEVVSVTQSS